MPSRPRSCLSTIREEAERLDRFVGNLLDMSRLEAGALGVKLETADVHELVEAAVKRLARRLSGHRIVLDLPDDLPLVSVDPLVAGAGDRQCAGQCGKICARRFAYSHSALSATIKRVILTIEDEGPGIPPADLPHIFDKFYRAKAADRRIAGTGLGLAVARGFVEAFGGTLDAANRTDGTRRRVDLFAAHGQHGGGNGG